MLSETQLQAAIDYAKGETIVDIAKKYSISRQTFYNWLEKDEFKSEVDKYRQEIKSNAERLLTADLDKVVKELKKIALSGKSEKVKFDAIADILDRSFGKATTRIEDVTDNTDTKKELSWDNIPSDLIKS